MVAAHKKVLKIMKKMGLQCKKAKRFALTTNSKHNLRVYPNLSKDLVLSRTDQLWCADITYIRILTGFVYLTALIDAFSKNIVGYAIGRTLGAKLPLEALKMAIRSRNTNDLIHHSDKGRKYCSYDYTKLLESRGIKISMSAKAISI